MRCGLPLHFGIGLESSILQRWSVLCVGLITCGLTWRRWQWWQKSAFTFHTTASYNIGSNDGGMVDTTITDMVVWI